MSVTVNVPGSNYRTIATSINGFLITGIVSQPTGGESAGAKYLVAPLGTGIFEGQSDSIAILTANQGWLFVPPSNGLTATNTTAGTFYIYNGSAWVQTSAGGGGSGGLGDRNLNATSPAAPVNGSDHQGIIFVDGAAGSFILPFDPTVLPGMSVRIVRLDSSQNVNTVTVTGEAGTTKAILTANGDWAELKSHAGGTIVKLISSGTQT